MTDIKLWKERVVAWRASGLTSTEFSAGRGFSAGGLRHWAHRLGKLETQRGRAERRVRLAPVERGVPAPVEPEAVAQPLEPSGSCAAPSQTALMLEVAGGRIAVSPGFDAETLSLVLDVLERRSAPCRRAS